MPRHVAKLWNVKSIYITENGTSGSDRPADDGAVYDLDRIMYLRNYLTQLQLSGTVRLGADHLSGRIDPLPPRRQVELELQARMQKAHALEISLPRILPVAEVNEAVEEAGVAVKEHKRRPRQRKSRNEKLPDHLSRYEVTVEASEETKDCPEHGERTLIGYDRADLGAPRKLSSGRLPRAAGEAVGSATDFAIGDRVAVVPAGPAGGPLRQVRVVGLARDVQVQVTPTLFVRWADYVAAVKAVNPDAVTVLPSALGVRPVRGVSPAALAERINKVSVDADALTREQAMQAWPVRNPALQVSEREEGLVTIELPRRKDWMGGVLGFLFSVPQSKPVQLDEVGSFVWGLCDGDDTVSDMVGELVN